MRKLTAAIAGIALLAVTFVSAPAWAKEPATPELTMKQVYEMAVKNSDDLESAEASTSKTWESREDASEDLTYAPSEESSSVDSELDNLSSSLIQADLGYRMALRNEDALLDEIELNVFSKYTSVQLAEENLRAAEQQLKEEMSALKVVRSRKEVGLVSGPDVVAAETSYAAAVKNRDVAAENVKKAYVSLNNLISLWPEDRPVLVDKIDYQPLKVDDIDTEVSRALETSDSLWSLVQQVYVEKRDLRYRSKVYDVEKYDIETAEASVEAKKKDVAEDTRTMYSEILNLEQQYKAAQESLKMAEENCRVAKVRYEVGIITQNDLIAAETDLSDSQNTLCNLLYEHEVQRVSFLKLTGRDNII